MSSGGSSRLPSAGGGDVPAPEWMRQSGGLPRHPSQIDSTEQAGLSLPQIMSRPGGYSPNLTPPDGAGGPGRDDLSNLIRQMQQQQQPEREPEPVLPLAPENTTSLMQRNRWGRLPDGMAEDDPLAPLYRAGSAYQK